MANYSKAYKECFVTDELERRRNSFTPDFLDLKLQEYIPVFVYGTLKIGQKRFDILQDQVYLGEAYTATQNYLMENSEMDFPIAFDAKVVNPKSASLFGEVFLVKPEIMLELDRIESNGEMYERKERWLYLLDQKVSHTRFRPSLKCWVYLGKDSFWRNYTTSLMIPRKFNSGSKPRMIYEWQPSFSKLEQEWNDRLNDRLPF